MYQKFLVIIILLTISLQAQAGAGITSDEVDHLVQQVMGKFDVPGIAVGIIKDGTVIHARGYGVRNINKKGRVDAETLFSIASTGKSFTTAAIALLVDEGKVSWDDKVIDYLPDFRMYDPWVTREFTVRDLLIHNSGLGLGAGDLMFWPTANFTRKEIISNLQYLKPVSSFRSEFAYDNLLYIVAGEVIAAVSGMPYEDFVDNRILKPLGMKYCAANLEPLKNHKNVADPHMVKDGKIQNAIRDIKLGENVVVAAAGGMQCSVKSILKWHDMHLRKGRLPSGDIFLSKEQQAEIMTPQTILPVRPNNKEWFNSSFSAYGLGWVLSDYKGYKIEQHSGGLLGMLSLNAMIPDLGLGVVIYTNQQAGVARSAIMNSILDTYISDKKTDWISRLYDLKQKRLAAAAKAVPDMAEAPYVPTGGLTPYAGSYRDPWFGDVIITENKSELTFMAVKSERLKGKMVPFKSNLFIVRWDDRSLDADAYVKFSVGYDGKPQGITMKAVSALTDFSFDFHDLNFKRIKQ
ncbi:MAG: serine hydrolase [Alphaproteobacteria bacterium]|nr:MAG: serine hydrolase [Alphaproteobacteria bacterium]